MTNKMTKKKKCHSRWIQKDKNPKSAAMLIR